MPRDRGSLQHRRGEPIKEDDDDFAPSFAPAKRDKVGLLIGLWAESGGGKTLSALKLGRGLAVHPGEDWRDPKQLAAIDARIYYVDTDGARAKHYAPAPGELPSADPESPSFGFQHADFRPPFSPERMVKFVDAAEAAGAEVIIVDSFSLVWEGEGGVKDIHDDMVEKAVERRRENAEKYNKAFDEDAARESVSLASWNRPKTRNRMMVTRLLQSRAHLIFCGHADDKLRMEEKVEEGRGGRTYKKTEITAAKDLPPRERWVPICEKKFPRQLVMSLILAPDAPGIPIPVKLSVKHRPFVPLDRPLDELVGLRLSAWAHGASAADLRPGAEPSTRPVNLSSPPAPSEAGGGSAPRSVPPSTEDRGAPSLDDDEPALIAGRGADFEGRAFDPLRPCALAEKSPNTDAALKEFAAMFRAITAAAPPSVREAWREANDFDLLQVKGRSAKLYAWALEHLAAPADA